jgi:hypothetical protein
MKSSAGHAFHLCGPSVLPTMTAAHPVAADGMIDFFHDSILPIAAGNVNDRPG